MLCFKFYVSCFLIVLLPLFFCISLIIKLDSRGPVLFKQLRVGKAKNTFVIYKFRTMHKHEIADQRYVETTSSSTDPRITRFGRILRSMSLDELPQLINIIKGEMAFIGPRPILPEQLQALSFAAVERFEVLPGLTGLAQIRGRRGLHWHQQLKLDVFYVKYKCIQLDLYILFRTVVVVLGSKNIYGKGVRNWRDYLSEESGANR